MARVKARVAPRSRTLAENRQACAPSMPPRRRSTITYKTKLRPPSISPSGKLIQYAHPRPPAIDPALLNATPSPPTPAHAGDSLGPAHIVYTSITGSHLTARTAASGSSTGIPPGAAGAYRGTGAYPTDASRVAAPIRPPWQGQLCETRHRSRASDRMWRGGFPPPGIPCDASVP
jgi:hypothetical protein